MPLAQCPNGQAFTNVFADAEGESTAISGSYVVGGEHSVSTKNGQRVEYGTVTRSLNLQAGFVVGRARTQTMSISNWMKANSQYFRIGKSPQLD
ncbi:hypothetical protein F3J23_07455 [Chryseobacterium sp. Tr-659]|uniref:hypothetical protein n=1 Tax=Chryseobacterium sp. Tr-659 TaxID=2608340 RepID=UPI00142243A0|nr:hypothetical protein [Chryseobacterium sp. Tr-659]NIF05277.1 hypothetical protein [Chryseobacterium sp. Tr-659]